GAGRDQPRVVQVNLLVQMLQALVYLHRRGILHRDLKPTNVLVAGGQVKVLDFGLSRTHKQSQDSSGTTVGTLAYLAPEIIRGEPASEASDLYAVGMIAYEMFVGYHPFNTDSITALLDAILHSPPELTKPNVDEDTTIFLERLLA